MRAETGPAAAAPQACPAAAPHVGCAGWSLPAAADPGQRIFPVEGSHLERYAQVFSCVEINSSFYRPHQPATYARWRAATPPGFRFAVKLPRLITHEQRLREPDAVLERFLGEAGMLQEKLGALLVQLPPSLALDVPLADAFFTQLRERLTALGNPMVACEARHASWFGWEGDALLDGHGVVRVIADPQAVPGAAVHETAAAPVYIRLHGSPEMYRSAYTPAFLRRVARTMRAYRAAGKPAWCIFDNTANGAAVPDALQLRALLE
jgi:uncharacterized protein YecE (DUF72 family)